MILIISFFGPFQRENIQAASNFAHRNQLPVRLQDQMLAHLSLRYRTDSEGVQQQETIDALPKAIRSSISHFLFYSAVDQVYLFRGVSNDVLFQLVKLLSVLLYLCLLCVIKCQKTYRFAMNKKMGIVLLYPQFKKD